VERKNVSVKMKMKIASTTLCTLLIAIYLMAVTWSADQRTIAGLEKMVARDDRIISHMLNGEWDRSKPICFDFIDDRYNHNLWEYYQDGCEDKLP